MTATELAPRFFIAATVILVVCRGVSMLLGRLRQPPVVGEMIAGVLLGPSLLGLVAPGVEDALFPQALRPVLYVAGQVGLVTMMFQAGRELRGHLHRRLAGAALAISSAGVAAPVALGIGLTALARGRVPIFVPGVSLGVTAAFVGVALAITAFPMLARIISENGLSGTRFGQLALACGSIDDVLAWMGLAAVLSVASARAWPVVKAAGGAAIFAVVVAFVVRPLLARLVARRGLSDATLNLVVLAVLFGAAWYTDEIGLYAVFGAFSIGLAAPPSPVMERVAPTTNAVTLVLVPMFFTYSGLNTRFALLGKPSLLVFALVAIVLAITGKFGACWLAARACREPNSVALRVGTLINARGLMQLIALNIGLAAHIVNNAMFTALVLVALVTTVMTTPVLHLIDRRESKRRAGLTGSDTPAQPKGQVVMASLPHDGAA